MLANQKRKRVAIIGAGPGGLSAGLALHQAGFDVTIFERHPEIRPLGGAIIMNAIGINILRSYGITIDDTFSGVNKVIFRSHKGKQRVFFRMEEQYLEQAHVNGWQSGMMRSELYEKMLAVIPEGMIVTAHKLLRYEETEDKITAFFDNGKQYDFDLIIGADGVNSNVRQQLWDSSELKHLGIAVWLGWAEVGGIARDEIVLRHSELYQFGYAPLIYKGKECFEWWFVEACTEHQPEPPNPHVYLKEKLKDFEEPVQTILNASEESHTFRWVIKYREPLEKWSKGRATLLGDAAHPTSPYAAYGAGMAIEDGFFLGKYLKGKNLSDIGSIQEGLNQYDKERVKYCNDTTSFARKIGRVFHNAPKPFRMIRDFALNNTKFMEQQIAKSYLSEAQNLLQRIVQE
ncbi:FAD-dependent monooxygenase [Chitinophagaceae bacterium LB-8]|uniref:FAD-dependent monooxygenase n=1 Tax=Paraflavisolibacter caeni TaxID=2982496 RepID=A0A9X3B7V9_9BACT|nr:FAD-dependent monooxygenase [Paraflavisolibacter caeni]MCU7549770.1 FAD-dependent monooxygenase [Paraflavisolibacter caeni]